MIIISLVYGTKIQIHINLYTKENQTHRYIKEPMSTKEGRGGREIGNLGLTHIYY